MQKKLSSKSVYEGAIFQMTRDEVEINGQVFPRDVIHHDGGVGVLAIKDGKILLVKQYRYAVQEETLEVPAGKLEKGEDPCTCGLRELEEESGYTTERLETLCTLYSTPGFCSEKIYLYWTKKLIPVEHPRAMDEDEDIEVVWIDVRRAQAMVNDGTIQDAKTIIAIQFANLYLL
ncbi:NUDIX hydrolase [Erysipelotrichaceae bacterium HCN-30851]